MRTIYRINSNIFGSPYFEAFIFYLFFFPFQLYILTYYHRRSAVCYCVNMYIVTESKVCQLLMRMCINIYMFVLYYLTFILSIYLCSVHTATLNPDLSWNYVTVLIDVDLI